MMINSIQLESSFFWGATTFAWDLADYGSEKDYTPVSPRPMANSLDRH